MTLADFEADGFHAGTDVGTESNADRAYEVIRERLVMLDIRPGEPINDDRLWNGIDSSSRTLGAARSRPPST